MKHFYVPIALAVILSACSPDQGPLAIPLEKRLENPLFAEQYAKTVVLRMTEIEIHDDPILQDDAKRTLVTKTKQHWMEVDRDACKTQREGRIGNFVGVKEYALGEILLLGSTLFLGPTFEMDPGPETHIILSTALDPRDRDFPDEGSIDIGPLQSHLGAQRYEISEEMDLAPIRSTVLWDSKLERIHGFAQLS